MMNTPEERVVEEDVKVEAVGGVALEESVQEVAQLGRGSARNPEKKRWFFHLAKRLRGCDCTYSVFQWLLLHT